MNYSVQTLFDRCSNGRVQEFLNRFGVDAGSVITTFARVEWRPAISAMVLDQRPIFEEAVGQILALAGESGLNSVEAASLTCGNPLWDIWVYPTATPEEKVLDVWLTDRAMFETALRIYRKQASVPVPVVA